MSSFIVLSEGAGTPITSVKVIVCWAGGGGGGGSSTKKTQKTPSMLPLISIKTERPNVASQY